MNSDQLYAQRRAEVLARKNKGEFIDVLYEARNLLLNIENHQVNSCAGVCVLLKRALPNVSMSLSYLVASWPEGTNMIFPVAGIMECMDRANKYEVEYPYYRKRINLLNWIISECCRILGETEKEYLHAQHP